MKRSLTLAIVEVSLITLVDSFITCENCYAFMKPVSFAVVLYDVTQRSSPQTASENRTTFPSDERSRSHITKFPMTSEKNSMLLSP